MSTTLSPKPEKGYRGLPMEGLLARWYARTTARNMADYRAAAAAVAAQVEAEARVLEVASGPGYLAIELAKVGRYQIVGLDISSTFVQLATANARNAGVAVAFHHGDVACMPFDPDSFDVIVCRAAFKNFSRPAQALREMHRVLKPGGKALIFDLRTDATPAAIAAHVKGMGLGWFNSLLTRFILGQLRKRAHSPEQFRHLASQTPFQSCDIQQDDLGLMVSLTK
jgi:ubiquinone/menaquinone biosynthesis C-methylase UbiE